MMKPSLQLLKFSEFLVISNPFQISDELKERREYLKLRKEAKDYNKMIYGTEE